MINHDLPEKLAEAPQYSDVEMMVQDFYKEQQIQGARIYYIHQYLHDLPVETASIELQRIKDAMTTHSHLLIDELVLPDSGASRFSMQWAFTMMAMFNSMERTMARWRKLLGDVGLEVPEVYFYGSELEYSILQAELRRS